MMNTLIHWHTGLDNFRECKLVEIENKKYFYTILHDKNLDSSRPLKDIFNDHIKNRQTKYVEVLYSGGLDSETTLKILLDLNVPVKINTMVLKYNDVTLNTHDLYYAEKYCRVNNLEQNLIVLDVKKFFDNGDHVKYLSPYYVTEPHVATHFWLLEQCSHYPILGGDWPYVQQGKQNRVLSPSKLDYSVYDLFMKQKGIFGVGNMLGYSFDSVCYFIQKQIEFAPVNKQNICFLKKNMYSEHYSNIEPRVRSYGWEKIPTDLFNILIHKLELIKYLNATEHIIEWGKTIQYIMKTNETTNSKF